VFVQRLIRFVAVEEDVVHPEVLFVFGQLAESDNAEMLQVGQAVLADGRFIEHFAEGRANPLQHGIQDVLLVAEVPVDRAPGYTGGTSNFFQRCPGNAFLHEHALGGIEQGFAGGFRLGFCLSRHDEVFRWCVAPALSRPVRV